MSVLSESYTFTLDDDPLIHREIRRITGVPTKAFLNIDDMFAAIEAGDMPITVFVDLNLGPNIHGANVLPLLRSKLRGVPLLVISSNPIGDEIERCLNAGAVDYFRKPLVDAEVKGKFHLWLAKSNFAKGETVTKFGDLLLDNKSRLLQGPLGSEEVSPREFLILSYLISQGGSLVTSEQLIANCWPKEISVPANQYTSALTKVRKVVSRCSKHIQIKSLYGKGYKLIIEIAD